MTADVSGPGTRRSVAAQLRLLGVRPARRCWCTPGCVRSGSSAADRTRWYSPCVTCSARAARSSCPPTRRTTATRRSGATAGAGGLVAGDPGGDAGLRSDGHAEPVHGCARRDRPGLAGALRSSHPHVSFAALGPAAEQVVAGHTLADMLGEGSPLARLYDLDADVLLLGVGHSASTSLHLAEYRCPGSPRERVGAAVRTADGGQEWAWWQDVRLDADDFDTLGVDLEATGAVRTGPVGVGTGRLMRQRAAVDFAVHWLARHRTMEDA
ncbi:AAC(3) family N-acetyltransferase [Micromonospora sp. M12]